MHDVFSCLGCSLTHDVVFVIKTSSMKSMAIPRDMCVVVYVFPTCLIGTIKQCIVHMYIPVVVIL